MPDHTADDLRKLWMIARKDSPFPGATRLDFYYETTVEGCRPWLADVDEGQMFEPHTFEIDAPDPCGRGFPDADDMAAYLSETGAEEIGWVDYAAGTLHITRDISVEAGWGGPPGSLDLTPTSFDVIHANAEPAAGATA